MSALEFAYNDSVHPATGYTPFQLDMGRDPNTPIQFLLKGLIDKPALYHERHELIDPTIYLHKFTSQLNEVKARLLAKQTRQHEKLTHKGTVPIQFAPGDGVYVENPLTTHKAGMSTLDRRYDGPYPITERVAKNTYRVDFGQDFPTRHNVQNADKLIPYLNRRTGDTQMDVENEAPRQPHEPPDDWGTDPAPQARVRDLSAEAPYQKQLSVGTQLIRINTPEESTAKPEGCGIPERAIYEHALRLRVAENRGVALGGLGEYSPTSPYQP